MGKNIWGGLFGGLLGAMIGGRKDSNKDLGQLLKDDPSYVANPLAAQRLGMAKSLYNAPTPGLQNLQNNLYTAQGNTLDSIKKYATDSSQALSVAAGAEGNTDNALNDLQQKEVENRSAMLANLNDAYGQQIREGDKVYGDQVRRFQDKAQIKGAQSANNQAIYSDILGLGSSLLNFGLSGGLKKSG